MERSLNDLPVLLTILLAGLLWLAAVLAIIRMDTTTRAMLAELQKTNAALFLVHGLVEGPPVKGKPRIVRAAEHRPGV